MKATFTWTLSRPPHRTWRLSRQNIPKIRTAHVWVLGAILPLVLLVFYGWVLRIPLEFCCPPWISRPGNICLFSLPTSQKPQKHWFFGFLHVPPSSTKFRWVRKSRTHSKSVVPSGTVGSNPTHSARKLSLQAVFAVCRLFLFSASLGFFREFSPENR